MPSDAFLPLRLAGVERESIVDGPGFRYVLFVQGCPHNCPGCHNPQTHDFEGGYTADPPQILQEIAANPLLQGVTFSGGEPFCQAAALCVLARSIREMGKNIVVYSGFTLEQLLHRSLQDPAIQDLLHLCDILIDGPFILAERDLSLQFRGSRNQRIIDLHAWASGQKNILWKN